MNNNKTSLMIMTAGLLMAAAMSIGTSIKAETFEVSDHPTSMQILSLINMYNQNNPNSPIVCSSGFVFPQESHESSSSSSSTTSIVNQIGQAIDEAVGGVKVPGQGQHQHHNHDSSSNNNNNNYNQQDTIDMAKRTSTPVDLYNINNADNGNDDGVSDDSNGEDDTSSSSSSTSDSSSNSNSDSESSE